MTVLRNLISVFGLFLLTQCNTKTDENSVTPDLLQPGKNNSANLLAGEWKYSQSIWYTSELILKENGTFKFHDQGCYGQRLSEGQWIYNNGTILLTSFDSYKQNTKPETIKSKEGATRKIKMLKLKTGDSLSFADFKNIQEAILPGANDTVRVYLNKIQLQLRSDTLYCTGPDKLPEKAKFYRVKNNR